MESKARTSIVIIFLVVLAAVSVEECWSSGYEPEVDRTENSVDERSWADSANGKLSEETGLNQERLRDAANGFLNDANDAGSKVADMASEAIHSASGTAKETAGKVSWNAKNKLGMTSDGDTKSVNEGISDTFRYAVDKTGDSYDEMKQKMNSISDKTAEGYKKVEHPLTDAMNYGRNKAAELHEDARKKMNGAYNAAPGKADNAKDILKSTMEQGGNRASDAYGQVKEKINLAADSTSGRLGETLSKVEETYDEAKKKMTDEAKATYESSKEKLSLANGNIGTDMRMGVSEL